MLRKALRSLPKITLPALRVPGLRFPNIRIFLPFALICLTPVFGWCVWKGLLLVRQQRISSLHNRLAEQSLLLGTEVKTELERFVQRMTVLGDSGNGSAAGLSEADWGILSFAVWARSGPGATPERKLLLTQDRALTPEQDTILKSEAERQLQLKMVEPAFEGKSLLLSDPGIDPRSIGVLIVPLGGPGKITQVALGHVRLSGIQRAFGLKLSSESFLVNSTGMILAHSSSRRVGHEEPELAKAIFENSAARRDPWRLEWVRFRDGQKKDLRSAITRMIQVGDVAVVSDVPSSELSWNRREILAMGGLACLGLVLLAWSGTWVFGWDRAGGQAARSSESRRSSEDRMDIDAPARSLDGFGMGDAGGATMNEAETARESNCTTARDSVGITDSGAGLTSVTGKTLTAGLEEASEKSRETEQPPHPDGSDQPAGSGRPPERRRVAVLHGAIWLHDGVLLEMPPQEAALVMNDFFLIGQQVIGMMQGSFERVSGNAFSASWVADSAEHGEARTLLKCALALREEFRRFNEARKVDGYSPLTFVMGADWDFALLVEVNTGRRSEPTVVGDPVVHARALSQLAVSVGTDLLVSQDLWNLTDRQFIGRHAADATLTHMSGLRACYTVRGYRNVDGKTVLVEIPRINRQDSRGGPQLQEIIPPEARWMVNTGSSILGPLTAAEVAQRLYSLDLDFDSECWVEGKGKRLPLFRSGIFGGSDESDAAYWIFDGNTIHGPMSEGFLKTALQHGAVSPSSFVCQGSTVNGWKKVTELGWPELQIPDPRQNSAPLVLSSVETSATRIIEPPLQRESEPQDESRPRDEEGDELEPTVFVDLGDPSDPGVQGVTATRASEPPPFDPAAFDTGGIPDAGHAEGEAMVEPPPFIVAVAQDQGGPAGPPEFHPTEPPELIPDEVEEDLAARIAASVVLEVKMNRSA